MVTGIRCVPRGDFSQVSLSRLPDSFYLTGQKHQGRLTKINSSLNPNHKAKGGQGEHITVIHARQYSKGTR